MGIERHLGEDVKSIIAPDMGKSEKEGALRALLDGTTKTATNEAANRVVTTEAAYKLEAQAIVVQEAQLNNRLKSRIAYYAGMEMRREEGLRWYFIHYQYHHHHGSMGYISVLSNDCNEDVLEQLRRGQQITIVEEPNVKRPDVAFGRPWNIVAAILVGSEALYKSPGFDVDLYNSAVLAAQSATTATNAST